MQSDVDLDAELTRVGRMRDLRRDYELEMRNREIASDRIPDLKERVQKYQEIQDLCDPSAMADEADVLKQLNGLLVQTTEKVGALVVLDAAYGVSIQGRHPALASDSVRLRAGFGVSCALAVISCTGIALLDRFESLDAANRKAALGMVKGLVDDGLLSTVLIAAVKDEPKRGANVPWLAWVKVADGTAEYMD